MSIGGLPGGGWQQKSQRSSEIIPPTIQEGHMIINRITRATFHTYAQILTPTRGGRGASWLQGSPPNYAPAIPVAVICKGFSIRASAEVRASCFKKGFNYSYIVMVNKICIFIIYHISI